MLNITFHTVNPGDNLIKRRSTDSSVTIPFERTFRDVDTNRPASGTDAESQFNFCGCGWPQHMLVPKGKFDSDCHRGCNSNSLAFWSLKVCLETDLLLTSLL